MSLIDSWPCRLCPLACEIHEAIVLAQAMRAATNPLATFWAGRLLHGPSALTNEVGMSVWTCEPVARATSTIAHGAIDLLALLLGELPVFSEDLSLDCVDAKVLALHLLVVARTLLDDASTGGTGLCLNCHVSFALRLLPHVHVEHVQVEDVTAVQLIQLARDLREVLQTQRAFLIPLVALHARWTRLSAHSLAEMSAGQMLVARLIAPLALAHR